MNLLSNNLWVPKLEWTFQFLQIDQWNYRPASWTIWSQRHGGFSALSALPQRRGPCPLFENNTEWSVRDVSSQFTCCRSVSILIPSCYKLNPGPKRASCSAVGRSSLQIDQLNFRPASRTCQIFCYKMFWWCWTCRFLSSCKDVHTRDPNIL